MSLNEFLELFQNWAQSNPHLAGIAIFFISLSESLVLIGLFIPGIPIMSIVGALIGLGALPWETTLLWATLGAIAGDGISYWVGYRFKQQLKETWPFNKMTRFLALGEAFFFKHGGKSIIFGRFVGPVRPMIPSVAGMMNMPPKQFIVFNVLSALLWAPIYCLPGILIGLSLNTLPSAVTKRVAWLAIFGLLLLWMAYSLMAWIFKKLKHQYIKNVRMLWILWNHPKNQHLLPQFRNLLQDAQKKSSNQIGSFIMMIFSSLLFSLLSLQVLNQSSLFDLNIPLFQLSSALGHSQFKWAAEFIHQLFHPQLALFSTVGFAAWLAIKKQKASFYAWSLSFLMTLCLCLGLNRLTNHGLEALTLVRPAPYHCYPNLQMLCSTQMFGLWLGFSRPHLTKTTKWVWAVLLITLLSLEALSLIYSERALFTDVLGGAILGLTGMGCGLLIYFRWQSHPLSLHLLKYSILSIYLTATVLFFSLHPDLIQSVSTENLKQEPFQTITFQHWTNGDLPMDLRCRVGAVQQKCNYFNVQYWGRLNALKTHLLSQGWEMLPDISFIEALNLFAGDAHNIKLQPLPEFHQDHLPALKLVKFVQPGQRLLLQIWASNYQIQGSDQTLQALWPGNVRIESLYLSKYWSFYKNTLLDSSALKNLTVDLNVRPLYFNKHLKNDTLFITGQ